MNADEEKRLLQVAKAFCAANKLEFLEVSGSGAFKATFSVRRADRSKLALKVYLPGAISDRTAREIDAMQKVSALSHANLPKFIALTTFVSAGENYLVSFEEFLSGGSLSEKTSAKALSRNELRQLAVDISASIASIAPLGLVHRDIKPDNIMYRADGSTAVLVDFGLVRDLAEESITRSWLARGPGTPYFASPEQLNNDKDLIDWRTDQFALGVSLCICAGVGHPYSSPGATPDSTVARVASREPPPTLVEDQLQQLGLGPVVKMIAPWPANRFRRPVDLVTAWQTTKEQ